MTGGGREGGSPVPTPWLPSAAIMAGMLEDYKSKYFQIVRRDFHSPRIWYIAIQFDKFISRALKHFDVRWLQPRKRINFSW